MPANLLSCNLNNLMKAAQCFLGCFSEEEKLSMELYLRIMELAGTGGGTDYTGKAGLLRLQQDAKAWNSQVLYAARREAIALYMDQQNAIDNNTATPTSAKTVKANSSCYACIPFEQKKNYLLFLKCKLNSLDQP